jgi:hypothetical protein
MRHDPGSDLAAPLAAGPRGWARDRASPPSPSYPLAAGRDPAQVVRAVEVSLNLGGLPAPLADPAAADRPDRVDVSSGVLLHDD